MYFDLYIMSGDTIAANPDRHTFNFGLIRDSSSGEVISLAPNFDNNMALISRGYPKNIERNNDAYVDLFVELMKYDGSLIEYMPELTEEIIYNVINEINMRVRTDTIVRFVMNGYKKIV